MLHCQWIWIEESENFFLTTEKIQLLENFNRPSRLRNPYPVSYFLSRLKQNSWVRLILKESEPFTKLIKVIMWWRQCHIISNRAVQLFLLLTWLQVQALNWQSKRWAQTDALWKSEIQIRLYSVCYTPPYCPGWIKTNARDELTFVNSLKQDQSTNYMSILTVTYDKINFVFYFPLQCHVLLGLYVEMNINLNVY